ncbi:hypothetical protein [Paucibacter sp. DJ2R-2]|uniref:hypothetical protein n=1 Tax=Paucibacter sp. DJ2R-2 TaxID=2893558 RepID=UPI0021E48145|nr:hypothetical protein [Paucibacter sp. DJ2R-2]MCV2423463.1 hypothetical protein [Paucibacter sp. DJ4R-1]MCV2441340.1 hypothetical protein [Paucibacter sp. DJ2R-2]
MATKATTPAVPEPGNAEGETLKIVREVGKSKNRQIADLVSEGIASNASTAQRYIKPELGEVSITELVASFRDDGKAVNAGDMSALERMLTGQALALNAMFGELARRSALNMGTHIEAMETYLKLALKAQGQSRATIETLAAIKSPPVVFARQANINNGGNQQVNNGASTQASRTEENQKHSHELLEASNGERLDFGAKSQASGNDQNLEAVGALNRPEDKGGKAKGGTKRLQG